MTDPRGRLRSHGPLPTLDAHTDASPHPCVVDLIGTAVERSPAVSDAVASSRQPVIEPPAAAAQPLRGACVDPHHPVQSP
jgi:hypothetical protein